MISRKRTSGKQAPVAPDEKGSASARAIPVADSAVTLRRQSIDIRRFGRRLPGDISIADIRTWVVISIMGIATSGCLWLAYRRWPKQQVWRNDFQTSSFEADPRRLLVWPCIAISILVVLLAIAEGILFTRLDRRAKTRREVLSATHHRVISTLRSARHVISYMSAVAVLATLFGYQNYDIYWVIALSFLSIFTFTSAVESLRYGDALFFAGAALFICAAFLPVNPDYHSSAGILGSPAVEILLGVLMTAAWWFRASRGTIILSVTICVLPLVTVLTGGSEAVLAPYVGLVGVGVAALAWVLGAGQRIGRGDEGSLVSAPAVQN